MRVRVDWGTWPRGTQCEKESRLMRPARGVRERGSVDWGAWPGRLYEMESRLGCLTWETMRGRVGWGTWPMRLYERESR